MCEKFKVAYFIGNGFDLHHGLKTQYIDLKEFIKQINEDLALKIDKLLSYCGCTDEDVHCWKDLENYFCKINDMDYDSILDNVFQNCETDIDKSAYWGDAQYNANIIKTDLIETLKDLKCSFASWIESINLNKINKSKFFTLDKDDLYFSFNYTETLEKLYGVNERNVIHMHGKIGEPYVLGHNDTKRAPYKSIYESHCDDITIFPEEDFRYVKTRGILNDLYGEIYESFYKNSIEIIKKYKNSFKTLGKSKKIIFMGLSMGEQDLIYIDEISKCMNKSCIIEIYYHSDVDLKRFKGIALTYFPSQKVEYIKW